MRLATVLTPHGPRAAVPVGGDYVDLHATDPGLPASVKLLLAASPAVRAAAAAAGGAAYLDIFSSKQTAFRLRLDQAVELAIFNSREFQDRREDLYLAALPVTLERFSFAAQAFAAERIIRQSILTDFRPGGPGENWQIGTDIGVSRTFATGGTLIVRLANQIVIDLSGPNPQVSLSNLSLTFAQPLLRGGGYAVTLENLTQSERTLLYAMRSYSRFRNQFYAAIAGQGGTIQGTGGGGGGGAGYTNNPYGLQGLAANLGRGVGANLTASPTGYFNTVLAAATLANQRQNVTTLEQFLKLFRNLNEGGAVTELQVGRVEQNLINSRLTVLTSSRGYLDGLDLLATSKEVELAALRSFFDLLTLRHMTVRNPALSVRGERLAAVEELTPEIAPAHVRALLAAIPADTLIGRRDRAIIGCLLLQPPGPGRWPV